jgi:signal transduction histidine kinase
MMHKMIVDYNNQKKFTENASHEIQTPIAVIKSKIELLLQSKNLNAKEIDQIISIDKACSRIINLNKSLLLLSKIENRQFITNEIVSFKNVINQSLLLFEDYINEDNLKVTIEINEDFLILMNPDLFMILINNLIQNAIRHNIKNGSITITCNLNEFIISNTGIDKSLDSKIIFERFNNNSNATNSIGLGLAISKEIVEISNLKLSYKFISKRHSFTISK